MIQITGLFLAFQKSGVLRIEDVENLAVAQNLLSEEIVDAAIGVLVADGEERVLLVGEGALGVVVDHGAAVEHRRENALAVAVVVELVQLAVDEDRQAAHREELLQVREKEEEKEPPRGVFSCRKRSIGRSGRRGRWCGGRSASRTTTPCSPSRCFGRRTGTCSNGFTQRPSQVLRNPR